MSPRAAREWGSIGLTALLAFAAGSLAIHWAGDLGSASSMRAVTIVAAARLLCARLFRIDRLPWGRLGLQDAAAAGVALASGTVLAGLAAPLLGTSLAVEALTIDLALELSIMLTGEGAWQLRRQGRAARAAEGRLRALIYGSDSRGRRLARALLDQPGCRFHAVGFLDDDLARMESVADGMPVLGPIEALPYAAELLGADAVLCATQRPSERVGDLAEEADVILVPAPAAGRLVWETEGVGTDLQQDPGAASRRPAQPESTSR